jgi:hypothetical protein
VVLGEIGVTIELDERWAVVPSYRFEHVFTTNNASPNDANIFRLGVRYSVTAQVVAIGQRLDTGLGA